ncbi:type II toxin-antitoxin system RelE/ParE family toxin, partial [Empedobacter falsenii]|uniref:type II toxin-antitoxin system RelE/ParE family toxin n=1 Tax=Empedobacter falsenii TaxID=343874 RepID=UPI001C58612C
CYKIRLAIKSKGKGKSGGARVITHLFIENETIYLLSLYDKSEQNSISDKEIKDLLKPIK